MSDVQQALAALALIVVLVWFVKHYFVEGRGFDFFGDSPSDTLVVSEPPGQVIDWATGYMATSGYTIAQRSEMSVTFTRTKQPDLGLGCLLLLLGIVPGLLYFGLFRGTRSTTLVAYRGAEGTQLVISGDDRQARRELAEWASVSLGG